MSKDETPPLFRFVNEYTSVSTKTEMLVKQSMSAGLEQPPPSLATPPWPEQVGIRAWLGRLYQRHVLFHMLPPRLRSILPPYRDTEVRRTEKILAEVSPGFEFTDDMIRQRDEFIAKGRA